MDEVKSTTIVPISMYCYVLGGYFLSLAINTIYRYNTGLPGTDFGLWLPVASFTGIACLLFAVGIGFLNLKLLCWKVLFFFLAISVSSMATLILVFLTFLLMEIKLLVPYFQSIQTTTAGWFSYLSVFLSEIVVLYYLCSREVVSCFGRIGPLISPF